MIAVWYTERASSKMVVVKCQFGFDDDANGQYYGMLLYLCAKCQVPSLKSIINYMYMYMYVCVRV